MKQNKLIVVLGVVWLILFVYESVNAQNIAYTRKGWPAVSNLLDLGDAMGFFWQKDYKALDEMVSERRCIIFSGEIEVSYWAPPWADRERQFHFPGSSKMYWTDVQALIYPGGKPQEWKGGTTSKREWFVLRSFLWIKPNKTTKQEIIKKYGKPTSQDEDSILYTATQNPDLKEWKTIKFIINTSGVVEEVRVQK
jgi:hypothetical protein